jgi:hypothetical protein
VLSPGEYIEAFDATPSLLDLVRNPFILWLFVEAFPHMSPQDRLSITRYKVMNVFVERWFLREICRLSPATQEKLGLPGSALASMGSPPRGQERAGMCESFCKHVLIEPLKRY